MKYVWEDLPKRLNCFTVRNARLINLNTGRIVSNYSANTKIVVVQKCVTPGKTYYRTQEAANNYLNHAFEASAFGLPDEKAPSARSKPDSLRKNHTNSKPGTRTTKPASKTKTRPTTNLPKDGEGGRRIGWLSRIFRRKNGKTKNT